MRGVVRFFFNGFGVVTSNLNGGRFLLTGVKKEVKAVSTSLAVNSICMIGDLEFMSI